MESRPREIQVYWSGGCRPDILRIGKQRAMSSAVRVTTVIGQNEERSTSKGKKENSNQNGQSSSWNSPIIYENIDLNLPLIATGFSTVFDSEYMRYNISKVPRGKEGKNRGLLWRLFEHNMETRLEPKHKIMHIEKQIKPNISTSKQSYYFQLSFVIRVEWIIKIFE